MLKMTSPNVMIPAVVELPTTVMIMQQHKRLMMEHYLKKKKSKMLSGI